MSTNVPSINENALKILKERHYLWEKSNNTAYYSDASGTESVDEMFWRVANTVASAESKFNKDADVKVFAARYFSMMRSLRFMPNTPTLINAGRERGQLAACYVLPIADSMEGIMDCLKAQALVQKSGGGTGFSYHNIRERGAPIKSTGMKAVGPVPIIKMKNYMMKEFIIQGGIRHGANMATLIDDHPDIEEFIMMKDEDGAIPSFNVSVSATDEFMKSVVADEMWALRSRVTNKEISYVPATYLFNLIATQAWKTGDPGLLFIDTANKFNPTPHLGRLEATNPCVSYETLVSTDRGLLPIGDIVRSKMATHILGPSGEFERIINYIDSGIKRVYAVKTRRGYTVRATDNHRWPTQVGLKETKDLVLGDIVTLQPVIPYKENKADFDKGELFGWLIGDGYLSHLASKSRMAGIIVGDLDVNYVDHINELIEKQIGQKVTTFRREQYHTTQLLSSKIWNWAVKTNGVIPHKSGEKEVPEVINAGSMSIKAGFLRGLFSADGHVICDTKKSNYNVRLSSKSEALIDGVQILLAQFGIYCTKYNRSRPPRQAVFSHTKQDGTIVTYDSSGELYELNISGSAVRLFNTHIKFTQEYKNVKLNEILTKNLVDTSNKDEIVEIVEDGEEETFCLTVEPSHRMCANGVIVSNCGEQWLLGNEACTLGHHNLVTYYVDRPNGNWIEHFNWALFEEDINNAVRFLDNVIEINYYALPEIEKMHKHTNRKIGLGVMGLTDLLIKLNVPYASPQAREIADTISTFLTYHADRASCQLGKERGSFGAFTQSALASQWDAMRNACRTTVAPTGTTAIIAGCTTGIEPIFALMLTRMQAGMVMFEHHPLFNEYLETLPEMYKKGVIQYCLEHRSVKGCALVDAHHQALFAQANEIDVESHVLMQAVWQKHVDNAVSKTINMPKSASIEDIKKAYMLAWKSGCKGITVYRDGCREHQALSATTKQATFTGTKLQLCRECGSTVEIAGGCETCKSCGWSACHI